jgi:amphiphysin
MPPPSRSPSSASSFKKPPPPPPGSFNKETSAPPPPYTVGNGVGTSSVIGKKPPPPPPLKPKPKIEPPKQYVIALYDFEAQADGDLSFRAGDRIEVVEKTASSEDWWTGKVNGVQGVFPGGHYSLEVLGARPNLLPQATTSRILDNRFSLHYVYHHAPLSSGI